MKDSDFKLLTPQQREFFLAKGYIIIEDAVPEEHLKRFSDDAWVRLGMDPNDKSTWYKSSVSRFGLRLWSLE